MRTLTPRSSPVPGGVTAPRRPSRAFLALVGLVIAASVAVRLALLGRQSYWVDELFSVSESSGSLRALLHWGSTEVHTPLYAGLLWVWMRIGGTGEAWTHLLSTLCALAAVVATHVGLRGLRLSDHLRWALTVATAAGGTSIVYSLETRSYALLMLGSVGLTVTTLRAALLTLDGGRVPPRTLVSWTAWSALAATAHLFGAVLTLGALAVLAALTLWRAPRGRVRRVLTWVLLAAAGGSLQVAWLVRGLGRPGFAAGTSWIRPPRGQDAWDLVTTTFSTGGLSAHKDGYAWTSPAGVLVAAAVCAAAALAGYRARRRGQAAAATPAASTAAMPGGSAEAARPGAAGTLEGPAAAVLLALVAVVVVSTFAVSQWKHVWTLRNMTVVAPALLWGVICLAAAAAGTAGGRRRVAVVVIALLGIGLVPTAVGAARPYKTDFRGLFEYLAGVRANHPDAAFFFVGPGPPLGWGPVSDPAGRGSAGGVSGHDLLPHRVGSQDAVVRTAGTEVVVLYRGSTDRHPDRAVARLVARLGPTDCHRIPVYGLGVVRCG